MEATPATVLVCGLGGLGQSCLRSLMALRVPVSCLDLHPPRWDDAALTAALDPGVTVGDMRYPEVLQRAGVASARAVLLLTADAAINLEAALQVRRLNPTAQLVVRSLTRRRLREQLEQRIPGLAFCDPHDLTAGVFANALRPDGLEAAIDLEGERFTIHSRTLSNDSPRDLHGCLGRRQRLLQWLPAEGPPVAAVASGWWPLEGHPRSGNRLVWLEQATTLRTGHRRPLLPRLSARALVWRQALREAPTWLAARRGPLLLPAALALLVLLVVGGWQFGGGSFPRGVMLTLALLKGEFLDAFSFYGSELGPPMTLADLGPAFLGLLGTLLTAWLVGLIVERLVGSRFGQRQPSPLAPGSGAVLLIEGGTLARRVAQTLRAQNVLVLRVASHPDSEDLEGCHRSLPAALRALRHGRCLAVGVLGEELIPNLEIALDLGERWPSARLAVQATTLVEARAISSLLSSMELVNPLEVAADAVVATAFGERVLAVVRICDDNLLITEYRLQAGDTLVGCSLAQVSQGYGLVVMLHTAPGGSPEPLPREESQLQPGARLVVLATLEALHRVEQGQVRWPTWCLRIASTPAQASRQPALQTLARFLGGVPSAMAPYLDLSQGEPLTPPLHGQPARLLADQLRLLGIRCQLVTAPDERA
ncbi:MAG: NAD-binding protein [Cyanobacteriota bacterium]